MKDIKNEEDSYGSSIYDIFSKAKQTFQYQFTCEHCGKQNPQKSFTLTAIASKNVSGKGRLRNEEQFALQQQAATQLQNVIKAKKNHIEKGSYGQDIRGKCDFCSKRQSWEIKSAKLLPLWRSLSGLAIGFFIMFFASLFGNDAGNAATVCIPIGFAGGLILGFVQLAKIKSGTTKNNAGSKPIINW